MPGGVFSSILQVALMLEQPIIRLQVAATSTLPTNQKHGECSRRRGDVGLSEKPFESKN